jgi:E3 ubiquitin-protein ligase UBR4
MLDKLSSISSLAMSKPMMAVLLKLFGYCVKLGSNRQLLLSPEMGTTPVLLNTLKLCLAAGETLMATGEIVKNLLNSRTGTGMRRNVRQNF